MNNYILDACAAIALLNDEIGADVVSEVFHEAQSGNASVHMSAINLLEVHYGYNCDKGKDFADKVIALFRRLPVNIIHEFSDDALSEASRVKTQYGRMSLADSVLLGTAKVLGAAVVTCDHHEMDKIDVAGELSFQWIR